jgi:amino acid adenylation domain-containing protein
MKSKSDSRHPASEIQRLPSEIDNGIADFAGGILDKDLANLSLAEKRMLLAELLREKAQQEAAFPLSHGQRGLWFLHQLDPAGAAYNVYFPARIRAPLDVPAFRRALQTLIDRHPSLRTTFAQHDGQPRQRVHSSLACASGWLQVHDAAGWSESDLRARVEEEAYRPFDLEHGPLVRIHLFARAPDDHVFLITAHHIIGDFWSLVVLVEEMQTLYPAACAGLPAELPPPARDYRAFVRWQTELLQSAEGERLWSYWRKQLADVPPVLELPADRPRPPRFTHRGAAVPCRIGPELIQRLKALAASEGVTLYTVLLAAFEVLLSRHSGQEEFVVGSPFAGRSRAEFERVVGYFINVLPLRADLTADPSFRDLLRQVGATVLEALQHQDYPFPLLVERLGVPREPSRPPLVQASFTLEKAHRPVGIGCWSFFLPASEVRLHVGGLPAEPYPIEHRACQMDVEMILEESDGTLYGMIRYYADLFDADTMQRLAAHYLVLLEGAAAEPDRRVSELPLLTPSEQRQLLYDWNDTRAPLTLPSPPGGGEGRVRGDSCLHQLFEQQAARTPDAIALRFGERIVRYGELDAWANRLAEQLRHLGVGPGVLVALCLERSPEMIAAILGVLKAGGAFVPLDPASPAERFRVVLEDTRAPLLLTQRELADRFSVFGFQFSEPYCSSNPIILEAKSEKRKAKSENRKARPEDLAYVLYTSGSTGPPKGVMIEHRAICNTIQWHCRTFPFRSDDRVLLLVPYVFDAALSIIFPTLVCGAELLLAEPGVERDPTRVRERLEREGVTVLPILPRILRLMLDERLRQAGRSLRLIYCGGETMPPDLPQRVFDLLDVRLFNLYGPTETAIDATWWECRRGEQRACIPIGRPIADVQVYVLDRHRRPVPVGVPGELYVGGAGLGRGYLNDPETTAQRFLSIDDFGWMIEDSPSASQSSITNSKSSIRLYRTGDRCRWLAEGCLEFLGRLDQQVKLRGYRIEIGEIEAMLTSHPAVSEAAVLLRGKDGEEQRLVAYVSARAGTGLPTAELLRRYLRERLPDYAVPSQFVLLPSLPHTSSGKVNRQALPAPLAERPATQRPFVAPRTPLEQHVAGLWREILGIQQIGIDDNFFDLGGSSIQAAVLVNRLQEQLGQTIYTVSLFDSPTLAGFVSYLTDHCPEAIRAQFGCESLPADHGAATVTERSSQTLPHGRGSELVVTLQAQGARPACFLVHPPGGIVVCYQALARHLGDDRPFHGIRARGLHGETELPSSLRDMAAEYVAAIRSIQPHGPYHLGGWSMGGVVAYEMAQHLRQQGQAVGLLALLDTTIPQNAANAAFAPDGEQSAREYGLDLTLEELDRLGPEEQLPYLWQHVCKLGLIDADTPLPLVRQILDDLKRLFHAHIQLANDYAIQPYPGRVTLFRPTDVPVAVPTAPDRNWGKLAAEVEIHFVPGHHHSMVKEPHAQVLAQQLRLCLRQAEQAALARG